MQQAGIAGAQHFRAAAGRCPLQQVGAVHRQQTAPAATNKHTFVGAARLPQSCRRQPLMMLQSHTVLWASTPGEVAPFQHCSGWVKQRGSTTQLPYHVNPNR
jgi:hypothetical protein